ncbi:MAG: tryptophan synthase subunit alpha, partial [Rhodospirillales bacterium]|nr:tryptophan synthase subunit alpha [Rhodospirillales bacterium]
AVGFGIRTPEQASRIAETADAVVVGSALVDAVEQAPENAAVAVCELVETLKAGVLSARKA